MSAHLVHAALDAGGDGVISEEEIGDAPRRLRELDANGDGRLDVRELLR